MRSRNLIILIATIVVIVVAWKISQQKAPSTAVETTRLYPELIEKLNDIARVSIKTVKNETVLAKIEDNWVVANRDNFPANFPEIKSTLINLAGVTVIEEKSSKPENYAKIGVAGVEQEDSESVLVHVEDGNGGALASILIGNERSGNNLGTPNYYVRMADGTAALLVEGDLDFDDEPGQWMETDIVNVDTKRVQKVSITRDGEPPIILSKESHNENFFNLEGIPTGFTAASRTVVSSIGAVLLNLKFDNVAAAAKLEGLIPRTIAEVQTFDGLVATLEQFDYEEDVYIRFRFAFDPDIVIEKPEMPEALAATLDSLNNVDKTTAKEGSDVELSVADEVTELNAKVADWVYALPSYKLRLIDKKFDDLIKPEETAEEPAAKTESE